MSTRISNSIITHQRSNNSYLHALIYLYDRFSIEPARVLNETFLMGSILNYVLQYSTSTVLNVSKMKLKCSSPIHLKVLW